MKERNGCGGRSVGYEDFAISRAVVCCRACLHPLIRGRDHQAVSNDMSTRLLSASSRLRNESQHDKYQRLSINIQLYYSSVTERFIKSKSMNLDRSGYPKHLTPQNLENVSIIWQINYSFCFINWLSQTTFYLSIIWYRIKSLLIISQFWNIMATTLALCLPKITFIIFTTVTDSSYR